MNVKPGDRARLVNTQSANDGAVVLVRHLDGFMTCACSEPIWVVAGEKLLGFRVGPTMIPADVVGVALAPDRCLRRIDCDEASGDKCEPVRDEVPA